MVTFPNCKINLGLNILHKRTDNFHDIETLFYPVPLYDVLEIINSKDHTQSNQTGIHIGDPNQNLCFKATELIKKDYPQLPEIKLHLHKVIPIGAGLGGGSSDAAFTLSLLNEKYQLQIPPEKLFGYALQSGSDCPFFLINKPSIASGRGEILEPVELSLSGYQLLLVNPGIHINTGGIFKEIQPAVPVKKISEIILQPLTSWKNDLKNDFEKVVFPKYPEIKDLKEKLYDMGAVYASMTGTGSTVYGIFNGKHRIEASFPNEYFVKILPL